MLKNSMEVKGFAQIGEPQSGTIEPPLNQYDKSASSAPVAKSLCDPACPSCGAACNQHGSEKGLIRYRCQQCFKVFSVSPQTRRARRNAYEKWLADIAS